MAETAYIDPDAVQVQLGDMSIASSISLDAIAKDAAGEMNVRLGERYITPLDLDAVALLPHHRRMVELINARLAAGRLIMSIASPSEDRDLHRYGQYLVDLAMADLDLIVSGRVILGGQTDATVTIDQDEHRGPSIANVDEESGVEAFNQAFYGGNWSTWWAPGQLP